MSSATIPVAPLDAAGFSPYGHVIATEGNAFTSINGGRARRTFDLAPIETDGDAPPSCSIVTAEAWESGRRLSVMERHPACSQIFFPLGGETFVVVVSDSPPSPDRLRAFVTNGRQGVSYARNVWHHPVIALSPTRFLVIDGGGAAVKTEERPIEDWNLTLGL